jgi:hypothetical protein
MKIKRQSGLIFALLWKETNGENRFTRQLKPAGVRLSQAQAEISRRRPVSHAEKFGAQ